MPRGVDWSAAEAWYLAEGPTRSFGKVGRKFAVSDSRVCRVAKARRWVEKAEKADRSAAAKVEAAGQRTLEQRTLKNARLHDLAADKLEVRAEDEKAEHDEAFLLRLYETTGKWVRVDAGEPSDHITVAEATESYGVLIGAALDRLPLEERQAFLDEVRERLGAIGEADAA